MRIEALDENFVVTVPDETETVLRTRPLSDGRGSGDSARRNALRNPNAAFRAHRQRRL